MKRRDFAALMLAPLLPPAILKAAPAVARIAWDASTLVRVAGGTYGRMIRLRDGSILCSHEAAGKSLVVKSRDNGRTWSAPILVREIDGALAANPEMVQLASGRILLFFNQRPRRADLKFAIGMSHSDDGGATWTPADRLIYEAGADAKDGCWEPAPLLLPSGELQLFFANEAPFSHSDEQEITLMRSRDGGASWSEPQRVVFRAGHRDGMPVPILLRDWSKIIVAIEDNGLAPDYVLQPALVSTTVENNWRGVIGGESVKRWGAVSPSLPARVYAGAPYLRQMPCGATILSCQSNEGGRREPRMVVYVGDEFARNFTAPSVPFEVPGDVAGSWNALFVKGPRTITAISDVAIGGVRGVWAIDGALRR